MKTLAVLGCALAALAPAPLRADDPVDALDSALSASADHDEVRARLSGALDLEAYNFAQPAPGLIYAGGHDLFNPRLSLFLDAQLGPIVYVFAEARLDRGFDPGEQPLGLRLEEIAARISPWADGRLNLQVGKFATVVGNWAPRHDSWDNPFVTAPLPYENLTGVWSVAAPRSVGELLLWGNAGPRPAPGNAFPNKDNSIPILWGPSYASGAAVSGRFGDFDLAAEIKNGALSSRPADWDPDQERWTYPTVSARLGLRPDESWDFGLSASTGSDLEASAASTLAPGEGLGDYRETVLGQDASFAWHHLQLWAEAYEARFQIPRLGNFGTLAYYVEAKYKLTAQLFGALRWNQQLFASVPSGPATRAPWGNNLARVDLGPGYRFTAHTQLKVQFSLQDEDGAAGGWSSLLAAQFTLRF
jgi:hypothetical protein